MKKIQHVEELIKKYEIYIDPTKIYIDHTKAYESWPVAILLQNKLNEINEEINLIHIRRAFISGSRSLSSPIHKLFNFSSRRGDINLVDQIFQFAGVYYQAEKKSAARKTLLLGNHIDVRLTLVRPVTHHSHLNLYLETRNLACVALNKNAQVVRIPLLEDELEPHAEDIEKILKNLQGGWFAGNPAIPTSLNPDQQKQVVHAATSKGYQPQGIYAFFYKLNSKKDNNEDIYDKQKILRNIFAYAGLEKPKRFCK